MHDFFDDELILIASHLWAGATLCEAIQAALKLRCPQGKYKLVLDDVWSAYIVHLYNEQRNLYNKLQEYTQTRHRSLESPCDFI